METEKANITARQFKKALEQRKIYVVGNKFTRNGWTMFTVFRVKNNQLERIIVPKASYFYRGHDFGDYKCVAWGTNRVLEIILAIGYALKLNFSEIKQTQQFLS